MCGLGYLLPFCHMPFHLLDCFLYCVTASEVGVTSSAQFCFCCLYFGGSLFKKKTQYLCQCLEIFPPFFPSNVIVLRTILSQFLHIREIGVYFDQSTFVCPVFSVPFIEKTVTSPVYGLDTFVKNPLTECAQISFWSLFWSIDLIFSSYYSFLTCYEIRYCIACSLNFYCSEFLWLFCVFSGYTCSSKLSNSVNDGINIWIRIALNLQIAWRFR